MRHPRFLRFLVSCAAAFMCSAEVPAMSPAASYAGQEVREIKAMSLEDVQAYLSGKGMGLAKAAELNGYPGPSHVLALSSELGLTPEQRQQTESLFATMEASAIRVGRQLIEEERMLDRLFATVAITPEALQIAINRIAALQASVRMAHLDAHLAQVRVLTSAQTAHYTQLRGYAVARNTSEPPDHRH